MSSSAIEATKTQPRQQQPAGGNRGSSIHAGQGRAGWLFTAPMIVVLGLFLVAPIVMALYVSFTDYNGNGAPFGPGSTAQVVGPANYTDLFTKDGLERTTFMQSLGNTFWYVIFVVPLQTVTSLGLALIVNAKNLRGKGFFRTAFYFPSVTSSIAITTVFLFLFANSGAVNAFLGVFGIQGPAWFSEPMGLIHALLGGFGVENPAWAQSDLMGRSVWDWLSGPSVAMMVLIFLAVWTTTGTFMLMFLAALQDLPEDVYEAADLDGAVGWKRLRFVTIPQLRPTIFLVVTLGLIGTWQVFDQIYVAGQGAPGGTTLTPAFLSYQQSFRNFDFGSGAAMAFIVFAIIVILTRIQRSILGDEAAMTPRAARRVARRAARRAARREGRAA